MHFKTPQGIAESLRRRAAKEARFYRESVALMNDTKWREVLVCASRLDLLFVAAFVASASPRRRLRGHKTPPLPTEFDYFHLRSPLPEVAFERHHIGDWSGMSGPYKRILWILFPRRYFFHPRGERKRYRDQRIEEFLDALAQLGKLPLEVTDTFVRVYGYKPGVRS